MEQQEKEWFSTWFDSPYYHKLYQNRDDKEAQAFINRLLNYLQPREFSKVLDLACGRGRHSIFLHQLGLNVLGLDISPQSIAFAAQFEELGLRFQIHDMRESFPESEFNFIFSFFTSFGYFESDEEHLRALQNISTSLTKQGKFIIDFLNPYQVRKHLVLEEVKVIDGTTFNIKRSYSNGYILKQIDFKDYNGIKQSFTERVRGFDKTDFESLFSNTDLQIVETFGNYQLNPFQEEQSNRLIIIAEKI